ncbi:MAG TPA: hypothetical protein PKA58_17520 [Polyangium sp.]|nr:hypothetical protein [Polyangium sp.]
MGVVLPHGGLVADVFAGLDWHASTMLLAKEAVMLPVEFATHKSALGTLRRNGVQGYLGLINDSNDDDTHKWHVYFDGAPPIGIPLHLLPLETHSALCRADEYKAGNVVIDGIEYRLHSACLPTISYIERIEVHVALLVRVDVW